MDGYQSLDFVETNGTASMPAQRLRQRRVAQQTEMRAPERAPRGWDMQVVHPHLLLITTSAEPSAAFKEAAARLERVSALPANWDGAGSSPPSELSVLRASELIASVYSSTFRDPDSWTSPNVTASERGEVMLEWWRRERKLTLYVGDAKSHYIKVWGHRVDDEMEDGVFVADNFERLWRWLLTD